MIYLAYIVASFTALQLAVALINLIFRQKLTIAQGSGALVSVLIPARNEETNIATILSDLQQQDYQNIEVIVFNDQSTDRTAEMVQEFSNIDNRIKLINSTGLASGWLGKNYACHSLAKQASGDFLLFLDADVHLKKDIINRTIGYATRNELGLLSIFPTQRIKTLGERFTVPVMNFILLSLLPLLLVQKSRFVSLSAANGQFMLFNATIYKKYLPHNEMKNHRVEDIAIARYLKRNNIKIACLTGDQDIQCRMYTDAGEAIRGFSKNVLSFFGESVFFSILFWLITTVGFIPILITHGTKEFVLYAAVILLIRVFISISSKQSVVNNILLLIPQQFALGVIIYRAIQNKFKKQYQWKGRNIY